MLIRLKKLSRMVLESEKLQQFLSSAYGHFSNAWTSHLILSNWLWDTTKRLSTFRAMSWISSRPYTMIIKRWCLEYQQLSSCCQTSANILLHVSCSLQSLMICVVWCGIVTDHMAHSWELAWMRLCRHSWDSPKEELLGPIKGSLWTILWHLAALFIQNSRLFLCCLHGWPPKGTPI